MRYTVFGAIWTFVAIIVTLYYTGGDENVNELVAVYSEKTSVPFIEIFIGFFWFVGISSLIIGIQQIIRNIKTSKYGENCYGKLLGIYSSQTYIDSNPILKASFAVYIPSINRVKVLSEEIVKDESDFEEGAYFNIKFYDNDINIGERIEEENMPLDIVDIINNNYKTEHEENKIIEVDGEKYIKIE